MESTKTIKCKEGCGGTIDMERGRLLQGGCGRSGISVYPCGKCGRLHSSTGSLVVNRVGQRAFLENGRVVHKDKEE